MYSGPRFWGTVPILCQFTEGEAKPAVRRDVRIEAAGIGRMQSPRCDAEYNIAGMPFTLR